MPSVHNGDHLDADLEALCTSNAARRDIDLLNAFLDEVAASESALWKLLKWSDVHDDRPYFNCKAITCFQDAGYNVYRIRPLKGVLQKYRVLYAYDAQADEFHLVAAVLKRNHPSKNPGPNQYNYEADHPVSKRIRDEYDNRGFRKLR